MSFIVMFLLGKYPKTENGNHYALTVICMLTSFVSIVPIEDKKTETVINAYIRYIYADKGGSQFILSLLKTNKDSSMCTPHHIHHTLIQW